MHFEIYFDHHDNIFDGIMCYYKPQATVAICCLLLSIVVYSIQQPIDTVACATNVLVLLMKIYIYIRIFYY